VALRLRLRTDSKDNKYMNRPYSIVTPDFDVTSGGIRVMWGLYGWLLTKGQVVHVNAQYQNPNFVAVYPEIMHDNPVKADHVVRYILNKPGVMSANGVPGPTEFDPRDHMYYFSRLFGQAEDENHYMFLPILDMHLFRDQKKKRTKKAVFFGKGQDLGLHPKNCLEINRAVASDQEYLADLLNECEVLYCYDPVTAMTELARLCGVRIIMFNPAYTKEQFEQYEPGMNGISWGKDEEIKLDTEAFREHYTALRKTFEERLENFIEETQK
jgi:O-antigen biosynthesis protein